MCKKPKVEVCVVRASVDWRGLGGCTITSWPVAPEDAYQISKQPIVDVRTAAVEGSTGGLGFRREPVERLWTITVVALIVEEAHPLLELAVEQLMDDVRAGRVQPGTHRGALHGHAAPFDAEQRRVEAELDSFRRRFLADLSAADQ